MIIPNISPLERSEGSVYQGFDGKIYKVINGESVEVPQQMLLAKAEIAPSQVVVGGKTYRNIDGKVFLVENNQLIPITDPQQLTALNIQMEKEKASKLNNNQTYIIIGVVVVLLLLKGR